jgi:hypothetical protein
MDASKSLAPTRARSSAKHTYAIEGKGLSSSIPPPYKQPPDVLKPFISRLDPKHVYITHIDSHPADFKRKMFMVPVAMNVAVVLAFCWRVYSILPWYIKLLLAGLGQPNETNFPFDESTLGEIAWEVSMRAATIFIDFILVVFVWPWPVEFVAARKHGNPTKWRWNVGFRQKEIYVRRSRDWDTVLGDFLKDDSSKKIISSYIEKATSPILQEQKTGYLLMNGQWDLDWDAMVQAHALVDAKDVALDAFNNIVLMHHKDHGWLRYNIKAGASAVEDEKRRQVFAFRDALTALGKEKLFYRWVEIVQFESTQPGGFGAERQEAAAKKIRDLFEKEDINFDELWKKTVGGDPAGL